METFDLTEALITLKHAMTAVPVVSQQFGFLLLNMPSVRKHVTVHRLELFSVFVSVFMLSILLTFLSM